MRESHGICALRKMKSLFLIVLVMFVGITNYAFIHHMVFEEHDIDYHIVTDKSDVHDHCTVCKIAEHHTTYLDSDFLPLEDISIDESVISDFLKTSRAFDAIFLRGPPQHSFL